MAGRFAGPRQVGKTTLANRVLARWERGVDLNWDDRDARRDIRSARRPGGDALVVLDEFHKWRGRKRWNKSQCDTHRTRVRFVAALV